MTFTSGKDGKATAAGTELTITNWAVNPNVETISFRNSKSGTFENVDTTFKSLEATLNLDWDLDDNIFGAPLSIDLGTELTNVRLYIAGVAGLYWHLPKAKVTSTPQSVDIGGRVETSLTIRANGPFGRPGSPVV